MYVFGKKMKNNRKLIWPCLVLAVAAACNVQQQSDGKDERPNIVVILCDDLGYADVGFNGSKDIVTPEMDKLASGGMIFSSAYVAHPFCGPSRAGLMTGRYPHKFGSQFNLVPNSRERGFTGILLGETFISNVLQDAGYHTGLVGKWHLGDYDGYRPNDRGFDDFYGFLGGGHDYFPERFKPKYQKQLKAGNKIIFDYLKPLVHNNEEVDETEYITDALSREAVRFVKDASNREDPFFLYLAYNAPHSPLEAKEEDMAMFGHIKDEKRRTYAGMVYAVDRGVGKLVEALRETGELENTLIVFFSDNGGKLTLGGNNYPLREGKGSTFEGGYRVPMFFHWPDKITPNSNYRHPVSALDLYPTFAQMAGAAIPQEKNLDGMNILPNILDNENSRPGKTIFAMRHRAGHTDLGIRKDDWKATRNYKKWKLYNITEDIGEQNDLSGEYPELLDSLVSEGETWSRSHTEPLWFNPENLEKSWVEMEMGKFKNTFSVNRK